MVDSTVPGFCGQTILDLETLLMDTEFFIRIFCNDNFGSGHSYLSWPLVGVAVARLSMQKEWERAYQAWNANYSHLVLQRQ